MINTAIILTKNEEIHIERCILSVLPIFENIYIIDSFSDDKTKEIIKNYPVNFLEKTFINHSDQFNWALKKIDKKTDWVIRIDADEYFSKSLAKEISYKLPMMDNSIKGIFLPRKIIFQNKKIEFGGISDTKVLRLFRYGYGYCDDRWMDEHIVVNGKTINFLNPILDHNLKPISWWISKHNNYANKEVFEIIKSQLNQKKIKNNSYFKSFRNRDFYYSTPPILRVILYFIYRYIFKLGFLDGYAGFCFHFLQGFWYRLIIDIKYIEIKEKFKDKRFTLDKLVKNYLFIDYQNDLKQK